MTLDPGPPRRNPSGGLGGAAPQWVRVLGSRPPPGSGSARITRNFPSRVQEGIQVGFGIKKKTLNKCSVHLLNIYFFF